MSRKWEEERFWWGFSLRSFSFRDKDFEMFFVFTQPHQNLKRLFYAGWIHFSDSSIMCNLREKKKNWNSQILFWRCSLLTWICNKKKNTTSFISMNLSPQGDVIFYFEWRTTLWLHSSLFSLWASLNISIFFGRRKGWKVILYSSSWNVFRMHSQNLNCFTIKRN